MSSSKENDEKCNIVLNQLNAQQNVVSNNLIAESITSNIKKLSPVTRKVSQSGSDEYIRGVSEESPESGALDNTWVNSPDLFAVFEVDDNHEPSAKRSKRVEVSSNASSSLECPESRVLDNTWVNSPDLFAVFEVDDNHEPSAKRSERVEVSSNAASFLEYAEVRVLDNASVRSPDLFVDDFSYSGVLSRKLPSEEASSSDYTIPTLTNHEEYSPFMPGTAQNYAEDIIRVPNSFRSDEELVDRLDVWQNYVEDIVRSPELFVADEELVARPDHYALNQHGVVVGRVDNVAEDEALVFSSGGVDSGRASL